MVFDSTDEGIDITMTLIEPAEVRELAWAAVLARRLLLLAGLMCGCAVAAILLASAAHADPVLPVGEGLPAGEGTVQVVGEAARPALPDPTHLLDRPVARLATQAGPMLTELAKPETLGLADKVRPVGQLAQPLLAPVVRVVPPALDAEVQVATPALDQVVQVTGPLGAAQRMVDGTVQSVSDVAAFPGPAKHATLADLATAAAGAAAATLASSARSVAGIVETSVSFTWGLPGGHGSMPLPVPGGIPTSSSVSSANGPGAGAAPAEVDPSAVALLLALGLMVAALQRSSWWYPNGRPSPG